MEKSRCRRVVRVGLVLAVLGRAPVAAAQEPMRCVDPVDPAAGDLRRGKRGGDG